eukprot:m.476773 g.476773  ORF g.476773 m.476773 type:complete len:64 (+) comp20645_c0_seq1:1207-1398(+)
MQQHYKQPRTLQQSQQGTSHVTRGYSRANQTQHNTTLHRQYSTTLQHQYNRAPCWRNHTCARP